MRRLLVALVCAALAAPLPVNAGSVSLLGAGKTAAALTCTFTRINFTAGSLGSAALARASSATYIDGSGILTTATTNAARFNVDANYPGGGAPPSLTGPFLLVEPAGTNLYLQSNSFNTTWSKLNGSVFAAAAFTSPDGTADGWTMTGAAGFGGALQGLSAFTPVAYNLSAWDKNVTGTAPLQFQIGGVAGSAITLSSTLARYSSTITAAVTGFANTEFYVAAATGTNGVFGAQLELAAASGYFSTHSSSYIATTTTTATRAADVVTFTQPAGCGHNTYTFDDNSTQVVSQAAGTATVPTNLNRPNIKFIDGSA